MGKEIQASFENGMIYCEYAPGLINKFKDHGGRWDATKRGWKFSEEQGKAIFEDLFGIGDIVTALIPVSETHEQYDGFCTLGGYVLAVRKSRDSSVQLRTGVELVSGSFSGSSGSFRHPAVGAGEDVIFRMNVYRSFAGKNGLQIEAESKKAEEEINLLQNVTDEILIAELEKRGYKITKN